MITKRNYKKIKIHSSKTKKNISQNENTQNEANEYNKDNKYQNLITLEIIDDASYQHFKSLLPASRDLCNGKTPKGQSYKVHIALKKDFATLQKSNHYRIIYVHNNKSIIAYIAVQIYKRDGGFMFIHKVCSTGGGEGTRLMKMILADAKKNYQSLGITYLSLTTHNLDLIDYYKQFNPTKTEIIDSPGTKALVPKKVAYMIWQLSPDMPNLNYS